MRGEEKVQRPELARFFWFGRRAFRKQLDNAFPGPWEARDGGVWREKLGWNGLEGDRGQLHKLADLFDSKCSLIEIVSVLLLLSNSA
jgi:hypothetical protein